MSVTLDKSDHRSIVYPSRRRFNLGDILVDDHLFSVFTKVEQGLPGANQTVTGNDGAIQFVDDQSTLRSRHSFLHAGIVAANGDAVAGEGPSVAVLAATS